MEEYSAMTLDPKALEAALTAYDTRVAQLAGERVNTIHFLEFAIRAYLDAADLVPRVQMDNTMSKKLMTAIDERDEARRHVAAM